MFHVFAFRELNLNHSGRRQYFKNVDKFRLDLGTDLSWVLEKGSVFFSNFFREVRNTSPSSVRVLLGLFIRFEQEALYTLLYFFPA